MNANEVMNELARLITEVKDPKSKAIELDHRLEDIRFEKALRDDNYSLIGVNLTEAPQVNVTAKQRSNAACNASNFSPKRLDGGSC